MNMSATSSEKNAHPLHTPFYKIFYKDEPGLSVPSVKYVLQPGQRLTFNMTACTLARNTYSAGDEVELIERTLEAPHDRVSSLGNWKVKCQFQTSVWTNIEWGLSDGIFRLSHPIIKMPMKKESEDSFISDCKWTLRREFESYLPNGEHADGKWVLRDELANIINYGIYCNDLLEEHHLSIRS